MPTSYIDKGAILSADGRYRYFLWREWHGTHDPKNWEWIYGKDGDGNPLGQPKACVFIMLNPSTADGDVDDPTIRRCVSYAQRWKYERLEVVNLFAYRTTKPNEMLALNHDDDPVGSRNQEYFDRIIESAGIIICAWGAHGGYLGQDETAMGWLGGKMVYALGLTKDGYPRHPLYLKSEADPQKFSGSSVIR